MSVTNKRNEREQDDQRKKERKKEAGRIRESGVID